MQPIVLSRATDDADSFPHHLDALFGSGHRGEIVARLFPQPKDSDGPIPASSGALAKESLTG